jgi:hypothetical protein
MSRTEWVRARAMWDRGESLGHIAAVMDHSVLWVALALARPCP